jgi:hypothetical protein
MFDLRLPNKNNNKAKCRPGGTLRVLAGKNIWCNLWALLYFSAEILACLI